MSEAKLAPNLPDWMQEHARRYLASGGTDGHMYRISQPDRPELVVPSLLLTTTGRKSGERFIFPLFYGKTGDGYIVVASKGGAPEHPGWYRNILADPEVEVQAGTVKAGRGRAPRPARSAPGSGSRRWSSGRPMRSTRRRPSGRSRSSCSTGSSDRVARYGPSGRRAHPVATVRSSIRASYRRPRRSAQLFTSWNIGMMAWSSIAVFTASRSSRSRVGSSMVAAARSVSASSAGLV
ncbi:nitroreductase/quinone reductase family protein [Paeniroseomonas aquatica]|uniref:nitroreductase/quinone reductase family protein n=1 Tax=Paeniroseomonas aquatica TaxID=373043 RepID=UPI0036125B1F